MDKLKICAWSGMISLIYTFIQFTAIKYFFEQNQHLFVTQAYFLFIYFAVMMILAMIFFYGFTAIGRMLENKSSRILGYLLFLCAIILAIVQICSLIFLSVSFFFLMMSLIFMIVLSCSLIIFGISLARSEKEMKIKLFTGAYDAIFGLLIIVMIVWNVLSPGIGGTLLAYLLMLTLGFVAVNSFFFIKSAKFVEKKVRKKDTKK